MFSVESAGCTSHTRVHAHHDMLTKNSESKSRAPAPNLLGHVRGRRFKSFGVSNRCVCWVGCCSSTRASSCCWAGRCACSRGSSSPHNRCPTRQRRLTERSCSPKSPSWCVQRSVVGSQWPSGSQRAVWLGRSQSPCKPPAFCDHRGTYVQRGSNSDIFIANKASCHSANRACGLRVNTVQETYSIIHAGPLEGFRYASLPNKILGRGVAFNAPARRKQQKQKPDPGVVSITGAIEDFGLLCHHFSRGDTTETAKFCVLVFVRLPNHTSLHCKLFPNGCLPLSCSGCPLMRWPVFHVQLVGNCILKKLQSA